MKQRPYLILSILPLLLTFWGNVTAQRRVSIIGQVTDAESEKPLFRVSVYNISKGTGTMTDSAGNYKIEAYDYNRLVFSYIGYANDTVQVNALYERQVINVFLHKNKYSFAPVDIIGQRPDYARDSAERRSWFSDALDQNKTRGLGAVSHPITALYDALSGRQKRLWRFQKDYKAFEQQKYIASRIHPKQIEDLFHLKGDSLKAFLLWYNPSYIFVRNSTDYELLVDIKRAVKLFRKVYVKRPDMDFENQNIR